MIRKIVIGTQVVTTLAGTATATTNRVDGVGSAATIANLNTNNWAGMKVSPDQVLITTGSQQGLDLIAKILIDAGSRILVETPTYLGALQAFTPMEPVAVSVNSDDHGVDPADLRAKVGTGADKARFVYLLPNFQNPTGRTMTEERRAAVAKVAVEFAKTNEKFVLIGGALGAQTLDADGIKALAELPSLDVLRAGASVADVVKHTSMDAWFIDRLSEMVEAERGVAAHCSQLHGIGPKAIDRAHIGTSGNQLLRLRQICCDPRLVKLSAATKVKTSAKLEQLMTLLPDMLAEGRRILLFSQFTGMLTLIEAELKKHQIPWVKLTGQSQKRDALIEQFTNGSVPLFLISLKAGGVGLNLPQADTVIHYDPWWNPAVETQATDRAHRIGQTQSVWVLKLVAQGTIEERILALQERKAALAEGMYNGSVGRRAPLFTESDLSELLRPLS